MDISTLTISRLTQKYFSDFEEEKGSLPLLKDILNKFIKLDQRFKNDVFVKYAYDDELRKRLLKQQKTFSEKKFLQKTQCMKKIYVITIIIVFVSSYFCFIFLNKNLNY